MNAQPLTYAEPLSHTAHARPEISSAKASRTMLDESPIIARLRKGDEGAFNELVAQYHGALIRMAMRYVAERDVAEEVVQDTWIAVIDGISRFEGRASLSTWMYSILIHKAKDRGVRESKHINFSDLSSYDDEGGDEAVDPSRFHRSGELAGQWALPPQPWDEQTPERLLSSKQAFAAATKAVDELPRGLREVLLLKDVEGFESNEICERLQITETNLYVRLHRARERVRQAVETALASKPRRDVSYSALAAPMATAQTTARTQCPIKGRRAATPVRM